MEIVNLLPLSRAEIRGRKPGFLKTAFNGIPEQLFLVRRVEPWFRNQLKRLVKTPKLHFLDSGLLGTLLGITAERVARDRSTFGTLLETLPRQRPGRS